MGSLYCSAQMESSLFGFVMLQDFKQRLLRLMLNTDGREGCPVRREIEKLIETRRWSTHTILEHNPARMMRIAVEVRSQKLHNTENAYDLDKQHRVLVRRTILTTAVSD
jgi:hypothetical protein